MAARRSKFTQALANSICKLVKCGVTIEAAAESEGVSRSTVYLWRQAGRDGKAPYVAFAADLDTALADAESKLTQNVFRRGKDDWRAAAWWLEKRNPTAYGDRSKVEHYVKSELEDMLDAARKALDPDSYKRLLAAVAPGRDSEG